MSQKLLVKSSVDYADEFDCKEFAIMTQTQYDAWLERVEKALEEQDEFYFGTNEAVQFYNMAEFQNSLTITKITDEEFSTLDKLFGPKYSFNSFVSFGTGAVFDIGDDFI